MKINLNLGKLKVPIIAGYAAGFILFNAIGISIATTPEGVNSWFLWSFAWPISALLAGNIVTIVTAIFVGILTWFALKK